MGRGLFGRARQPAEAEPTYEPEDDFGRDLQDALAVGMDGVQRAEAQTTTAKLRGKVLHGSRRIEKDRAGDAAPLGMVERIERFQAKLDSRLSLMEMFL